MISVILAFIMIDFCSIFYRWTWTDTHDTLTNFFCRTNVDLSRIIDVELIERSFRKRLPMSSFWCGKLFRPITTLCTVQIDESDRVLFVELGVLSLWFRWALIRIWRLLLRNSEISLCWGTFFDIFSRRKVVFGDWFYFLNTLRRAIRFIDLLYFLQRVIAKTDLFLDIKLISSVALKILRGSIAHLFWPNF